MLSNPTTEMRVINALRLPQNKPFIFSAPEAFFTDERKELFDALKIASTKYGSPSSEAMQSILRRELPPELDIPIQVDIVAALDELKRLARKRLLAEFAVQAKSMSQEFDPDISNLERQLRELNVDLHDDIGVTSGLDIFRSDLRQKHSGNYKYLSTGVKFLDVALGGEWPRGALSLITGRTGGGKSALAGDSALGMAMRGQPVGIISQEMPKDQLIARWVSNLSNVNASYIRAGKKPNGDSLTKDELERIDRATVTIESLPIYIVDKPSQTADKIVSIWERLYREHGVEALFVDYLQLISVDPMIGKHAGLGDAALRLIDFCKRYNTTCISLAQVHEQKETIRDTGDVDKHCAAWIHINLQDDEDDQGIRTAIFEFRKNRHGAARQTTMLFDSTHLRFLPPSRT